MPNRLGSAWWRAPAWKRVLWTSTLLLEVGCAFNSTTRRLQFSLIDTRDEIELGRAYDAQVREEVAAYDDPELQQFVSARGARIAARSERATLPWSFTVLDGEQVNAFALPGGFVYVTRGLLAYLGSTAALSAVLAHEVAHVNARHGANQMSKAAVAERSLGVFRVIDPNLRHVGGVAAGTAGLVLLRHSRQHEFQADAIGVQYVRELGLPPSAMLDVLATLERLDDGKGRPPSWISTHPEPALRSERIAGLPGAAVAPSDPAWGIADYFAHIDGLVVGRDPRQGTLEGRRYVHPRARLQLELPTDWQTEVGRDSVLALSADQRALLLVQRAAGRTVASFRDAFFAQDSVRRREVTLPSRPRVAGTEVLGFTAGGTQDPLVGTLAMVQRGDDLWLVLALTDPANLATYEASMHAAMASWDELDAAVAKRFVPRRIRVERLERESTLRDFARKHGNVDVLPELERINGRTVDTTIAVGTWLKWIEGQPSSM